MIKKTAYAISERLYDYFGDDYKIYIENVKQGFQKPCFVIIAQGSEMRREQKHRWYLTNFFKIECYTDDGGEQKIGYYDLQSKLFDAMAEIDIEGNKIFGDKMKSKVNSGNVGSVTVSQDGTADCRLEFYVNFDMYLTEKQENETMQKITEILKCGRCSEERFNFPMNESSL